VSRTPPILLLIALVLALAASSFAAEPNPQRQIVVYAGEGENVQPVATFPRAKCKIVRNGNSRRFKAEARHDGWELEVVVNDFSGFQTYDLQYGIKQTNFRISPPGSSGFYSNIFFPGEEPPPFAGQLTFPNGRGKMGLGFFNAFYSGNDDDAIGVAGLAKCRYPRR
jgi:hypothetical protein